MRIVALALESRKIELERRLTTARAEWTARELILVRLTDEKGRTGIGEAAPLPSYSIDSFAEARRELERLARDLSPADLDLGVPAIDEVRRIVARASLHAPSARFALETALLDLAGKALGAPVSTLLAGRPAAAPVEISALLPHGPPEFVVAEARALAERGFSTFKVKVGRCGAWPEELGALRRLRDSLGAGIRLRVDANGAWSPDEARRRLSQLTPLDLEFVEQPVAPPDLLRFCGGSVPLAADETLQVPGAVETLIESKSCAVLILKPMILGGALACLDVARKASNAGLAVVVTTLFDGPVAAAAAGELALALSPPPLASGLSPAFGAPRAEALRVPHDRPGLGLPAQDLQW